MSVSFMFLGGAGEVGNVALELAVDGAHFLCDYGYAPSRPPSFPQRLTRVPDLVLLSHCHVDHSGMVPHLCGRSEVEVLATPPTQALSELLAYDSLKVARNENYSLPYESHDVRRAQGLFDLAPFGGNREVKGVEVRMRPAGHVPGATMFELEGSRKVLFTGDINTVDTHLVRGTKPRPCDYLFVEGTYAGREHPDREQTEKRFVERVREVVDRGGKAIVPVFAVGRTQEVLMLLARTGLETWLDGMGQRVNRIMLDEPGFLKEPALLRRAEGRARYVRGEYLRNAAMRGEVIVTTGGMLDGGPVLSYLRALKDDRQSRVFLTGYQVEGTNGRLLLDRGLIDLGDGPQRIAPPVEFFDFSAHCGHGELVDFIKGCRPEKVVLFHGDQREKLAADLEGDFEVLMPKSMEKVKLA
ncbi:MAG: MBL fold metallo-hydrolase [Euryarchaeota archaeon]|nr:MBL fold metallo-hydrolase [Euryarchaeota archaeon]